MQQLWAWLSGKKTSIGATAGVLLAWAQAMGWIDDNTGLMLAAVLTIWTGVAVGHHAAKTDR
jgi:hypothetical protein